MALDSAEMPKSNLLSPATFNNKGKFFKNFKRGSRDNILTEGSNEPWR